MLQNIGRAPWSFRTKLALAAELVEWCVELFKNWYRKRVMVIVDGAYAKRPFLRRHGDRRGCRQPPAEGRGPVRCSQAHEEAGEGSASKVWTEPDLTGASRRTSTRLDDEADEIVRHRTTGDL